MKSKDCLLSEKNFGMNL